MCPTHNRYLAECDYVREVMQRYRLSSSLAREPGPVYSLTFQPVQGYFHHNEDGFLPLFPLPFGRG